MTAADKCLDTGAPADGQRPAQLLVDRPWPSELSQLLSSWWHEDPLLRPAFRKIVEDVKRLYSVEIPSPPLDVAAAVPPTLHQGRPAGGETGKNRAKHASSQSAKTSLGDGTYPAQRFTLRGKVARNLRRVAISHGSRRASMQPTDTNIDASSGSRNLQRPSRAATYPPPRPVHRNLKARLRMRRSTMPSSEQTMLQVSKEVPSTSRTLSTVLMLRTESGPGKRTTSTIAQGFPWVHHLWDYCNVCDILFTVEFT